MSKSRDRQASFMNDEDEGTLGAFWTSDAADDGYGASPYGYGQNESSSQHGWETDGVPWSYGEGGSYGGRAGQKQRDKKSVKGLAIAAICTALAALAIAVVLLFALHRAPTPEPSAGPWVEGDWEWHLQPNGVLEIRGTGNMANFASVYEQPWSDQRDQITAVWFYEGITSVGDNAFCGCHALKDIHLGSTVTIIGENAFADCSGLTFIDIPYGVKIIGDGAFSYCKSLDTIIIPTSVTKIGEGATAMTNIWHVYYDGDKKDWDAIDIGQDNPVLAGMDPGDHK
ncbi:MAG: leucine-rich repeat domain-containing protein [Oscillospiraceae bacterium]|nr:leucine-rich repeat domain-containing protein [Oscillospiraceae bacterium]